MSEWRGGKYQGNFLPYKEGRIQCRVTHNGKCYTKVVLTEESAKEWLMKKSEEFGIVKNKYRIVDGEYVEVQISGDRTFLCDVEDLKYVEERVWGPRTHKKNFQI